MSGLVRAVISICKNIIIRHETDKFSTTEVPFIHVFRPMPWEMTSL